MCIIIFSISVFLWCFPKWKINKYMASCVELSNEHMKMNRKLLTSFLPRISLSVCPFILQSNPSVSLSVSQPFHGVKNENVCNEFFNKLTFRIIWCFIFGSCVLCCVLHAENHGKRERITQIRTFQWLYFRLVFEGDRMTNYVHIDLLLV